MQKHVDPDADLELRKDFIRELEEAEEEYGKGEITSHKEIKNMLGL